MVEWFPFQAHFMSWSLAPVDFSESTQWIWERYCLLYALASGFGIMISQHPVARIRVI